MSSASQANANYKNAEKKTDYWALFAKFAPLIFLIILVIGFGIANDRFLSTRNMLNILTEVSIYGLLAVGMTFVILTAGIDLSVGSLLALCGMSAAWVATGGGGGGFGAAEAGYGWGLALATALGVGLFAGCIQGYAIAHFKIPAFVVTLGGMSIYRGLTLLIGDGGPISGFDGVYRSFGRGDILGIPVPAIFFVLIASAAALTLKFTNFGRHVYAVGGNEEAANLAGINVEKTLMGVYIMIGVLAGLAGFILTARLNSAEATAGMSYELRVIASVVIGGTSLFGGIGTIAGTIIGALTIGVLINGLVMLNIQSYWQLIIVGFIIVVAVGFDSFVKARSGGKG
ncbi:ABC transporter permease [Shimia sp. R10_1]|uniref:ABC transporter permease n=1 Tax=Shimia sp. R10_1 TaxID=2821095 RepID=UPI001ADBEA77|nr:ABC transporter permease [Shimia sp. R10_1]MBO9474001.1 ABC transporter permease [Shimia sp. R10_1]